MPSSELKSSTSHPRTPVQVVVIRDRHDAETNVFVDLLKKAVEGDTDHYSGYISESLGIGIRVLEPTNPENTEWFLSGLFGAAACTVALEIRSRDNYQATPGQAAILKRIEKSRRVTVSVPPLVANGDVQKNQTPVGRVEPGLHPLVATLGVLECIRQHLSNTMEDVNANEAARLFVSHAKSDGALLAIALVDFCRRATTLFDEILEDKDLDRYFYDAESIENNTDWREALRNAASQGVLIALRTDDYDTRYWCRQEFVWAEENRRPIVVVDLRKMLMSDGGPLHFDCATTVRVADGNLIRILLHAVAAHIRYLLLKWRVEQTPGKHPPFTVMPRHPTPASLHNLADAIRDKNPDTAEIVYPGRALAQSSCEVLAGYLTFKSGIDTELVSLAEWETT